MSWRDLFESDEYQDMIKRNMDFCPISVELNGKKFLTTRSWEYLEEHIDSFTEIPKEHKDKDQFYVWDLINEKIIEIDMKKVDTTGFSSFKGMRYFK